MDTQTFYDQVYDVVRLIPTGRVTSYGAIANCLGAKRSSRMVGYAMQHCGGLHPAVPAHRVVNSQGLLTGKFHFGGDTMQRLLEAEGVQVKNDKVVDFKKLFWDPINEIEI